MCAERAVGRGSVSASALCHGRQCRERRASTPFIAFSLIDVILLNLSSFHPTPTRKALVRPMYTRAPLLKLRPALKLWNNEVVEASLKVFQRPMNKTQVFTKQ